MTRPCVKFNHLLHNLPRWIEIVALRIQIITYGKFNQPPLGIVKVEIEDASVIPVGRVQKVIQ